MTKKKLSNLERINELKEAAKPLIKYLCENWHPHVTAIVTPTGVELLSGELKSQEIYDFIKD